MLWVLNLSDGRHSLLDIAERADLPFDLIASAASALESHGLRSSTPRAHQESPPRGPASLGIAASGATRNAPRPTLGCGHRFETITILPRDLGPLASFRVKPGSATTGPIENILLRPTTYAEYGRWK